MVKSGFTLIELLVAMAILGILATIGFGNFQSTQIKARDVTRKSDLATIAKSLEAYANDARTYPTSDGNGNIICQPPGTTCPWGQAFTNGLTIYTAKLPKDPSGFSYRYDSTGSSYSLYAHLENTNDPALTVFTPAVSCGAGDCNYKITSSNIQ